MNSFFLCIFFDPLKKKKNLKPFILLLLLFIFRVRNGYIILPLWLAFAVERSQEFLLSSIVRWNQILLLTAVAAAVELCHRVSSFFSFSMGPEENQPKKCPAVHHCNQGRLFNGYLMLERKERGEREGRHLFPVRSDES